MLTLVRGGMLGGHEGGVKRPAFSPDGRRFVVGDGAGRIVVRSVDGEVLASAASPKRTAWSRPYVYAVAWSPDGDTIASLEDYVLRLRRASDLEVVAEATDVRLGPIGFTGRGTLVVADRTLSVRRLPSLEEIGTVPLERRRLDDFDVYAVACDPSSGLVVTCDPGGRSGDEDDHTTDREEPRLTWIDTETRAVVVARDEGVLSTRLVLDPWRKRVLSSSFPRGVAAWSTRGELLGRWKPYGARGEVEVGDLDVVPDDDAPGIVAPYVPSLEDLAVTERFLVTMPSMDANTARTVDLWAQTGRDLLASAALPDGERPYFVVASPDGRVLLTPTQPPGHRGEHGLRVWEVRAAG